MRPSAWFDRKFSFDHLTPDLYPNLLERLRGTPTRLAERVLALPPAVLTRRDGEDWSIQEHSGHLLDLGELDWARYDDFLNNREVLHPADRANRKTHEANHNAASIETILAAFHKERLGLVERLEEQGAAFAGRTSHHPRLETPMRVIDWLYFVAEHDDHHLAEINDLIRRFGVDYQ